MDASKDRHGKRKASRYEEEGGSKRKKKHHRDERDSKSGSRKKDRREAITVVDDDAEDEDMWVEHNIDVDGQHVSEFLPLVPSVFCMGSRIRQRGGSF